MAELLKIESKLEEFKKEYFYRNRQAEENRQKENQAAIRIQSWFRACRVRAYISHLHKKAIIIQKIWRGFTARARVRQMVKAAYFIMKMNFYKEMAVRIQRRWRGFFARKYIHNFYARKSYMEEVVVTNELTRREVDEFVKHRKREREHLEMMRQQTANIYQTHRLHHLLSTKQRPGVFNSPFQPAPHEMELRLRQVKHQVPTRLAPQSKASPFGTPNAATPSVLGTLESPGVKFTTLRSSRPILPPIASKKQHVMMDDQQGVFRKQREMWEQRLQRPDLTLCLQTSYTHLEEFQYQQQQHESLRVYPALFLVAIGRDSRDARYCIGLKKTVKSLPAPLINAYLNCMAKKH